MNFEEPKSRSLAEGFNSIVVDLQHIFRAEIQLARSEFENRTGQLARAAVLLGVGIGLGCCALFLVCASLVWLLSRVMPMWAAALVVAGVLSAACVGLIVSGRARWRSMTLVPQKLTQSVRQDLRVLRDRAL